MRRGDTFATVTVELTEAEAQFLDRMRGGLSRSNELRVSLWEQAEAMGLNPPMELFDCRLETGKTPRPRKAPSVRPVRVYQRPRKPSARHPWKLQEQASWGQRQS